mmetsp:Transcript_18328/g.21141  ORF Transcript_18328/g.21141 Transcript_18328/m.21141 type:complete len:363 (-) Transcript_18328:915-2003(-)
MMTTMMTEHSAAMAMAAAVAAAAELAQNGGITMYQSSRAFKEQLRRETRLVSSPEPDENSLGDVKGDICSSSTNMIGNHQSIKKEIPSARVINDDPEEEDAEKRLARSRERNREHARRTRLRKKAQLEALQSKAKNLESERRFLTQSIEECSIANILVGLSGSSKAIDQSKSVTVTLLDATNFDQNNTPKVALVMGGKRKRFVSEDSTDKTPQPLRLNIDGQTTLIGGGKTNINWKSGVYCDENGVQRQLTQEQLESLRRERNRMHAKMTRDRKKCFIAAIEKTIEQLESDNKRMRTALSKVAKYHFKPNAVTPISYPQDSPSVSENSIPEMRLGKPAIISLEENAFQPNRVSHGFSLQRIC